MKLLRESFGGNTKTTMIVTCSMSSTNEKETTESLKFGAKVKNIKNMPLINQEKSSKELHTLLEIAEKKI